MGIADRVIARYLGTSPLDGRDKIAAGSQEPTRSIPKGHEFDKKALKPLSKALWACSVAQGHALTAYRQMSRLKSTTVSPDGRLGGRGYTQSLADMRRRLHEVAETLSSICDTLYDEATAPHWQPQLAQLDEDDRGDVSRFISEAQEVRDDPESEAEDEMDSIEKDDTPAPEIKFRQEGYEENSSSLPKASDHQDEPPPNQATTKTAASSFLWTPGALELKASNIYIASSSVSPDTLGGPRVDHLGPGEGEGPFGSFNEGEPLGEDQWSEAWKSAASGHPVDDTPTDAHSWGIGFGATGQGVQYPNPSGEGAGYKGVLGPQSGLPGSGSTSSGDNPSAEIDYALNTPRQAYRALYGHGMLPQDAAIPVARSDYYVGPKDNMVSVGASDIPSASQNNGVGGQPLIDTYYTQTDTDTGYVRWDGTTKTLREPDGGSIGQNYEEPWALDGEATR